jgi:hypothetical protein
MRAPISPTVPMALVAVLALSSLTMGACGSGSGQPCPSECPATYVGAIVAVTTTPAMAVSGVQATLTGPVTDSMSCQPNGTATACMWSPATPVTAGTYALQVSAPGYQTTTTQVEIAISPPVCGCTQASIEPSMVALGPSDGGICSGGCLCGTPTESQCTAEECERVYTRQADGGLKYDYCTNGPSGSLVLDGGSQ